jgi:hypothetical protein
MEAQKTPNRQNHSEQKSNPTCITIPGFKGDHRAIAANGIEDPKINPCTYSHPIFDKCAKNMLEKAPSLKNGDEKTGYLHVED